jgi:hypothetical protein
MKIRPLRVELFYADRQTDRQAGRQTDRHDEANGRFSQFCEAPKNSTFYLESLFMCFVWISEQRGIISLYSIN